MDGENYSSGFWSGCSGILGFESLKKGAKFRPLFENVLCFFVLRSYSKFPSQVAKRVVFEKIDCISSEHVSKVGHCKDEEDIIPQNHWLGI